MSRRSDRQDSSSEFEGLRADSGGCPAAAGLARKREEAASGHALGPPDGLTPRFVHAVLTACRGDIANGKGPQGAIRESQSEPGDGCKQKNNESPSGKVARGEEGGDSQARAGVEKESQADARADHHGHGRS